MTTDNMVTIVLNGAVRGKERVKTTKTGVTYTPERTVTFEGRLAYAAQIAMNGRPPLEGPLNMVVEMHFPIPASKPKRWKEAALTGRERPTVKPDWDNGGKLTDALNLIVWVDDKQIVEATVRKFYSANPRTVVRVWPTANLEGAFG